MRTISSRWLVPLAAVLIIGIGFATEPRIEAQPSPTGRWFACGADNIAGTLTLLSAYPSGNCVAVEDGSTRYITDIIAMSTTATGGEFLLRTGTGANCGTGTATLFPFAASTNVRLSFAGNTAAPTVISPKTPVQVPEGKDLCVIGIATNTVTLEVRGYIGPK